MVLLHAHSLFARSHRHHISDEITAIFLAAAACAKCLAIHALVGVASGLVGQLVPVNGPVVASAHGLHLASRNWPHFNFRHFCFNFIFLKG